MSWLLDEIAAMDEMFDDAHPRCEHCEEVGCCEATCPSEACDLPHLVVPPSEEKWNFSSPLLVHTHCVAAYEAGEEPPYRRAAGR